VLLVTEYRHISTKVKLFEHVHVHSDQYITLPLQIPLRFIFCQINVKFVCVCVCASLTFSETISTGQFLARSSVLSDECYGRHRGTHNGVSIGCLPLIVANIAERLITGQAHHLPPHVCKHVGFTNLTEKVRFRSCGSATSCYLHPFKKLSNH
jgi:hypothetical protein